MSTAAPPTPAPAPMAVVFDDPAEEEDPLDPPAEATDELAAAALAVEVDEILVVVSVEVDAGAGEGDAGAGRQRRAFVRPHAARSAESRREARISGLDRGSDDTRREGVGRLRDLGDTIRRCPIAHLVDPAHPPGAIPIRITAGQTGSAPHLTSS